MQVAHLGFDIEVHLFFYGCPILSKGIQVCIEFPLLLAP